MDINNLYKEFDSILSSISEKEFEEWNDFDNSQVLLEKFFNGESINTKISFVEPTFIEIFGTEPNKKTSLFGEINYNIAA